MPANEASAQAQATKHGLGQAGSVDDVLDHPEVEVVINLTIPAAHAAIATAAIDGNVRPNGRTVRGDGDAGDLQNGDVAGQAVSLRFPRSGRESR